jgi:hypothetical protein
MFIAKGRVYQGMFMGLMGASSEPKLYRVSVSAIRAELSEVVRGIWPGA